MYKQAVASFWTVEEVDLSQDQRDWDRLSGDACHSMSNARLSFLVIAVNHHPHKITALQHLQLLHVQACTTIELSS